MADRLQGKTAVVTGGTSGIGLSTARELIAQGAKVLLTGRKPDLVDKAAKEIGALGFASDQSQVGQIESLAAEAGKVFGKVDILFINAGTATLAAIEDYTEDQFDSTMDLNFKGAFFTLQKFIPLMRQGSSVTFLSSVNAFTGAPKTSVYGASKAALNSLTRTASYELAPKGIRVNAVCPGPVDTAFVEKAGVAGEASRLFNIAIKQRIPLKRLAKPEEIAKLVAFISSDDAAFITGSEYLIDGGVGINPVLG